MEKNKNDSMNYQSKSRKMLVFYQKHARLWMVLITVFSDIISLLLSFGIAIYIRELVGNSIVLNIYHTQLPIIVMFFVVVYTLRGLYDVIGMSPIDELRLIFYTSSIVFLLLFATFFIFRSGLVYSRLILFLSYVFSIVFVGLNRWSIRIICRIVGFWGVPTIIIGNGPMASEIKTFLQQNIHLGYIPIGVIDGREMIAKADEDYIKNNQIDTLVIISSETNIQNQKSFCNRIGLVKHIILISSLGWIGSLGVRPIDLEGKLGFELSNNLLQPTKRMIKKGMDLVIAFSCSILFAPLILLIAITIKLDSPGRILYKQTRLGRHGHKFEIYKFRTMYMNAEKELVMMLEKNPLLKTEWETTQKLRNDPRITRVGRYLRKWSLDELPQLFNILLGDMSVVGPRPCLPDQEMLYGETINLYKNVRPGLTGMWQVSGRNEKSFLDRVRYDEYYIRNWTPWMDIYIILRTSYVILTQHGAY